MQASAGTAGPLVLTEAQLTSGVLRLAVVACLAAAQGHASAVRMQSFLGSSPLDHMDEAELDNWMRLAALRCNPPSRPALPPGATPVYQPSSHL